jgi:putative two-component system response regulator
MKPAPTIYLVDDDSLMIKLYSNILQTYGYKVTSFQDPREGLKATLKNKPSLLLLDLKMPFIDGFDFLEQLRSKVRQEEMPVIVLTNLSTPEDADRAAKQGIADFIVKSDTLPEELVAKIKKVLK